MLVCGWAHVLHAVYKPWGTGTAMYVLQHASLGLTSFVFLMGLLFKVRHFVGRETCTAGAVVQGLRGVLTALHECL